MIHLSYPDVTKSATGEGRDDRLPLAGQSPGRAARPVRPGFFVATMNPFDPAPICHEFTSWVLWKTGYIIPPGCWCLLAGAMFLTGLLLASMLYRYWVDPKDLFP